MSAPEPERIDADPAVAAAAWRWPSSRVPGVFYDVALLLGPEDGPAVAYWDCTCPGFTYRDACQHVAAAKVELACEPRRDGRQAHLDARIGCRHPLTVDDDCRWRACVGCGSAYYRGEILDALRADIRERHRLPPSPWSAAERASDTE